MGSKERYHWQAQNVKHSGVDDMVLLSKISDEAIVANLKKRYMDDYIFTYIGPVLISVNPFKPMPYFTDREVDLYQGATVKSDLILTPGSVYLIGRERVKQGPEKGSIKAVLKRQIELGHIQAVSLRLEFKVKRDGWGPWAAAGTRQIQFRVGQGDVAILKPSSKTLEVSIGPGLPKNSRPTRKDNRKTAHVQPRQPFSSGGHRDAPRSRDLRLGPRSEGLQHQGVSLRRQASSDHPTLPKEGASPRAKTTLHQPNLDFMNVPDQGVAGLQRRMSKEVKPVPGGGRSKPRPRPRQARCRALYAYDAQDTDELSFNADDIIEIVREDPSGWWVGRIRGKEGLLPGNYVEKM